MGICNSCISCCLPDDNTEQPTVPVEPNVFHKEPFQVVGDLKVPRSEVSDSGSGSLKVMRKQATNELVAARWIPRAELPGEILPKAIRREITNQRRLGQHPNVVQFREVSESQTSHALCSCFLWELLLVAIVPFARPIIIKLKGSYCVRQ